MSQKISFFRKCAGLGLVGTLFAFGCHKSANLQNTQIVKSSPEKGSSSLDDGSLQSSPTASKAEEPATPKVEEPGTKPEMPTSAPAPKLCSQEKGRLTNELQCRAEGESLVGKKIADVLPGLAGAQEYQRMSATKKPGHTALSPNWNIFVVMPAECGLMSAANPQKCLSETSKLESAVLRWTNKNAAGANAKVFYVVETPGAGGEAFLKKNATALGPTWIPVVVKQEGAVQTGDISTRPLVLISFQDAVAYAFVGPLADVRFSSLIDDGKKAFEGRQPVAEVPVQMAKNKTAKRSGFKQVTKAAGRKPARKRK